MMVVAALLNIEIFILINNNCIKFFALQKLSNYYLMLVNVFSHLILSLKWSTLELDNL